MVRFAFPEWCPLRLSTHFRRKAHVARCLAIRRLMRAEGVEEALAARAVGAPGRNMRYRLRRGGASPPLL
ncbi:hypothetical protein GCM10011358_10470 [Sinisalibacter lacisalsi]|uniref:Uncharacterized protein n=1 Tax=Sinisalibacter lacisalsi TaxID=1526570 RepID=A0ABQ1QK05_9RHOB|nr:hypothetical protein GCM10011358_10470 [Sinisalibacter lacisalsi]